MIQVSRPYIEPNEDIMVEIAEVVSSGQLTNGKYVRRLEKHLSDNIGVKHVIAVSSCTSGLIILFSYLRKHKDWRRVHVPAFTFKSTIYAMRWANIEPMFVDIDESWTVDPNQINPRTPLIGIHVFGNPCDMSNLHNNCVFDAAHALGSFYKDKPVGSFGIAEVYSMAPTKIVTACEGGVICTNDEEIASYARQLRVYGNREVGHGLNARMSEVHAILGFWSAKTFPKNWKKRDELVHLYLDLLDTKENIIGFQRMNGITSYNYFGVLLRDRDKVYDRLIRNNIESKKYFESMSAGLIHTDSVVKQILCLPLHYYITEDDVYKVCELI